MGVSPFWAASLAAAVITCMTMFLIGGWSSKTVCSIVGTLAGILAAGLTAQLFGTLAHISGLNVSEFEVLAYIGMYSKLNVSEVLFSGILISSLGAVMDISMSVASVVSEIHCTAPELSAKELFQSGMRVGRDMMGTMSATLILAYAGGSINTLIIIYAYSMPYLQYINGYDIGINILSGISGAIGVILTVPFVSAVSAFIMTRREKR
ncbi:MAG TPA: YibE/F family protein [Clostridia bacterium]|nr:YibE/F family protein [Clostridia bacterium]